MDSERWQFWIDRGGTFTDVVGRRPDGRLISCKLLSESPLYREDAALRGIRILLGLEDGAPIPATERIESVRMGTTAATNALLERQGARTLLVTTSGFADILRIAYQNRPDLFARRIVLPEPLYARVLEINERINARGEVLLPLDEEQARQGLEEARRDGIHACAICLMHGYRYPQHEQKLAAWARELRFSQVSVSHQVSPLMKIVGRADTTVADAYLSPVLRRYVEQVSQALSGTRLFFMQSNGGLSEAAHFRGRDSILSGPAGGIVGAVESCRRVGFEHVISFDMGGTSTDVAHYAGELERDFESVHAGIRLRVPALRIHTIAAGGGSILKFRDGRCQVGPHSAGADPGPLCYRRGGPLTVTDCNLLLGRLQSGYFPRIFGPDGNQELDQQGVRTAFKRLAREIDPARADPDLYQAAEGFLRIAVANMATAIKRISVQRGHDVSDYVLCCFGGAGGQHACRVADELGLRQVLIHPLAGVLSAYGMGLAQVRKTRQRAITARLDQSLEPQLAATWQELQELACQDVRQQSIPAAAIRCLRRAHLHYADSDSILQVEAASAADMRRRFEERHQERFGFTMKETSLVVDAVLAEAVGTLNPDGELTQELAETRPENGSAQVPMYVDGRLRRVPLHWRTLLAPGQSVAGPAIIAEHNSTTVVDPAWSARLDEHRNLLLSRTARPRSRPRDSDQADPVRLEIFNNLFLSIAEQMGATLQNTAYSVNIKERLDFSCALFDAGGSLIANAPHVPVHLGSMGETVRSVIRRSPLRPGEVYALNNPYNGGTHLPDITTVTPVFLGNGAQTPLFYVASRGHHADVGGITPGSMPAYSTHLEQEGVLIDCFLLVQDGRLRQRELHGLLGTGPHPARNIERNVADLKAQTAANQTGVLELRRLAERFGESTVCAYARHVQDNAEQAVRNMLRKLHGGRHVRYPMDNGAHIQVQVQIDPAAGSAVVDFSGTSARAADNFNTPPAVTRAAVLYVFRTLVDEPIPLNDGCLKPVRIILPADSLLSPRFPDAVAAGNVETSQAISNALFLAFEALAASQGTMNNVSFGNDRCQYYETICGGAGAGPGFDGADAVHTHMTNSRITDPEILEWRFPVLLERFAIRYGSGGQGRYRGGNGVTRELRFLEAMEISLLSGHRKRGTFGLQGGAPGAAGRNTLLRADGTVEKLPGSCQAQVAAGDRLRIETPGGGACGKLER